MLDGVRDRLAYGMRFLAQRVASEPRDIDQNRIATSGRTLAGVLVTPDNAITLPAVWACLRYLTQTVGVLPWHVIKDGEKGAEIQYSNPVDKLLYMRPNPEYSSFQFRETLLHWALRWGNGYAEIERDTLGRPINMWPIHPDRVDVCRDVDTGEIYYEVNNGTKGKSEIPMMDMFHIRGFGEGPVGVSVVNYAAQSLGVARALQLFGASFFGNGATPTTVVINKRKMNAAGLEEQRTAFAEMYRGPTRAHRTAFLDGDADIKTISLDAEKSQLIEAQQFLVEDICRWFGVPPHKVMHLLRATFSNIEHQAIEVVVDSISPWVKRFEDEADYKLFSRNRNNLYTKINMRALMRGDSKSRMEYYQGMVRIGAYSPNRVLELEDENTIGPDGDVHVMQSQNITLEAIADGRNVKSTEPASGATTDNPEDDAMDASEIAARAEFLMIAGEKANV
ncbi:MAG: phage portal protein [Sterolibacterium sp.]